MVPSLPANSLFLEVKVSSLSLLFFLPVSFSVCLMPPDEKDPTALGFPNSYPSLVGWAENIPFYLHPGLMMGSSGGRFCLRKVSVSQESAWPLPAMKPSYDLCSQPAHFLCIPPTLPPVCVSGRGRRRQERGRKRPSPLIIWAPPGPQASACSVHL